MPSWVGATWAGWLLGVPVIAVLALIGEAVGIGGAQALVGAGMGCAIGVMQARIIRRIDVPPALWFWSCVTGLTLPFLATDLLELAGVTGAYSLQAAVAVGGLFVGVMQARVLRRRFKSTGLWIAASVVGWLVAAACVLAADRLFRSHSIPGLIGALLYVGVITGGGPVLGLITGWALSRMKPKP